MFCCREYLSSWVYNLFCDQLLICFGLQCSKGCAICECCSFCDTVIIVMLPFNCCNIHECYFRCLSVDTERLRVNILQTCTNSVRVEQIKWTCNLCKYTDVPLFERFLLFVCNGKTRVVFPMLFGSYSYLSESLFKASIPTRGCVSS